MGYDNYDAYLKEIKRVLPPYCANSGLLEIEKQTGLSAGYIRKLVFGDVRYPASEKVYSIYNCMVRVLKTEPIVTDSEPAVKRPMKRKPPPVRVPYPGYDLDLACCRIIMHNISTERISKATGFSEALLEQQFQATRHEPENVIPEVAKAVFDFVYRDVLKKLPPLEKPREVPKIIYIKKTSAEHPRLQRIHNHARAANILEKYYNAGYDTMELFCNAVLAVHPKLPGIDVACFYDLLVADEHLCTAVEIALNILKPNLCNPNS